jgi:hypothetical protein
MKNVLILLLLIVAVALIAARVFDFVPWKRTRSAQPCANMLRQIEGAKDQWALETGAKPGDTVTLSNIVPYLLHAPTCHVATASYVIGKVGEETRCTYHGTTSHFKSDTY